MAAVVLNRLVNLTRREGRKEGEGGAVNRRGQRLGYAN